MFQKPKVCVKHKCKFMVIRIRRMYSNPALSFSSWAVPCPNDVTCNGLVTLLLCHFGKMLNIASISDCKKIAFSKFCSYGKLGNICVRSTSSIVDCFMKFPFMISIHAREFIYITSSLKIQFINILFWAWKLIVSLTYFMGFVGMETRWL